MLGIVRVRTIAIVQEEVVVLAVLTVGQADVPLFATSATLRREWWKSIGKETDDNHLRRYQSTLAYGCSPQAGKRWRFRGMKSWR